MLILKSPPSIDSITDPNILKLVKMRHDQLGDEMFDSVIILESCDSISDIEKEIGFDGVIKQYIQELKERLYA